MMWHNSGDHTTLFYLTKWIDLIFTSSNKKCGVDICWNHSSCLLRCDLWAWPQPYHPLEKNHKIMYKHDNNHPTGALDQRCAGNQQHKQRHCDVIPCLHQELDLLWHCLNVTNEWCRGIIKLQACSWYCIIAASFSGCLLQVGRPCHSQFET